LARFSPPPSRRAAKAALGLPEDDIFLGCFGRVRLNKGTDLFVDVLIALCKADRRVRGAILGRATAEHADFQKRLEQRIRNAGLHHRIRFLGEIPDEDVPRWYRALDLFVAPQRWEGFGLTPLEAMACGTPSVATRVGAFEELIADGETGLLVPPDDLDALQSAVTEALSDLDRLAEWGAAALARAQADFPIEREVREILAVYDGLLEQHPSRT
ncbi:MAG: glycosyltransferase family 4 protein, partial [Pseudomonadota bacterium]